MKKESFKPNLFSRIALGLVPIDTEVKSTLDGYRFSSKNANTAWSFDNLKAILMSIPGVNQDSSHKLWEEYDDECYYTYKVDKSLILFEINNGKAKDNVECPSISIEFLEKIPSKRCFNELIEIIKQLKKASNKNLNFKIFSFMHKIFVSLEELSETNKMLK